MYKITVTATHWSGAKHRLTLYGEDPAAKFASLAQLHNDIQASGREDYYRNLGLVETTPVAADTAGRGVNVDVAL